MGSRAYTRGSDVYFGSGGFSPSVAAHELVHTVQQGAVSGHVSQSVPFGTIQREPGGRNNRNQSNSQSENSNVIDNQSNSNNNNYFLDADNSSLTDGGIGNNLIQNDREAESNSAAENLLDGREVFGNGRWRWRMSRTAITDEQIGKMAILYKA